MGKFRKKVHKYYEYLHTKLVLLVRQKKYVSGDVTLKYMLKKGDSENLVIVFSSCTRQGIKARYNYVRTLKRVKCDKLFILDDFADDHRGSYYIGSNMTFAEERATNELIAKVIETRKPKKVIFCGSSKGGWASLNFGLGYENAYIVCGGPQYYLGTYLGGVEKCGCTLKHIVGEVTQEKVDTIDAYLGDKIRNDNITSGQKIYIHYSNKEHTYEEHIHDLLAELRMKDICVIENVGDYTDHSEISLYFPDFLVKSIDAIVS